MSDHVYYKKVKTVDHTNDTIKREWNIKKCLKILKTYVLHNNDTKMIIIMTIIPMILKEREGAVTQSVRERESNHSTYTSHNSLYM